MQQIADAQTHAQATRLVEWQLTFHQGETAWCWLLPCRATVGCCQSLPARQALARLDHLVHPNLQESPKCPAWPWLDQVLLPLPLLRLSVRLSVRLLWKR